MLLFLLFIFNNSLQHSLQGKGKTKTKKMLVLEHLHVPIDETFPSFFLSFFKTVFRGTKSDPRSWPGDWRGSILAFPLCTIQKIKLNYDQ